MKDEIFKINELKSLILSKLDIRAITPGDCKRISIEITKTLNKTVSETTIKRLFGFAVAKHNFSRFTLTTLFEYVDQVHLMEPVTAEYNKALIVNTPRKEIHTAATKITEYTLKGIRNRSGLPYDLTIGRKFAEHDFQFFYNSNFRFTSFIAQPGYGKTTLLSHLVESTFLADDSPYKNSTVFFSNIYNLITEDRPFNLEERLKEQLGIPAKENMLQYVDLYYKPAGAKLIIILDGFGEVILKREIKEQIFDSIINFICALEDTENIKVVMSMRCTTWIRFYERMRHSSYLKSVWFRGNYFNMNDVSNVPPLTAKEVDQIVSRMPILDGKEINQKLKAQLKFPFHIQLYYQLNEEDPNFNYYTNLSFYELISRFIQEKIYRSNYYTEKILFLKKIILLTAYGDKGSSVLKSELINELSAFTNAYMELLADGILMEEKRFENAHPQEVVRFVHPHIFEYFLFIEILEKFNLNIGTSVFDYIKKEYANNQVYFIILQWAIRFLIKIGDFKMLTSVFTLGLNTYEKNYLMLFTAENLKYRINTHSDTYELIKEHRLHESIIKELTSFDLIDNCYKEAIAALLEIADTDESALVYQSILAIPDILSLNRDKILERIEQLAKYRTLSKDWIVDPFVAIEVIYQKITDTSITANEAASNIIHLKGLDLSPVIPLKTKDAISYILALAVNLFYGTQQKAVKIIETMGARHPQIFCGRSPFTVYMLNILGTALSRTQPGKKADQIERILCSILKNKTAATMTKYSETLFSIYKAEQSRNRQEYAKAVSYAEDVIDILKKYELNLNCLKVYNLIISIYTQANDVVKANEYKYERLCFLEDKGIPVQLFPIAKEILS
ncbi:hypothetical protein LPB86_00345 [Pedobacter sp. MC2016-14]|uniref:hypothetical protein n=1 Tax=Pedobacter sp. MC2016-14 TaxID=2897327 RepID=UPI001E4CF439|nr:hypothetical protein [Pedobacter sp. MC2016-14]MCD0486659.1 hypothetical protein [Pedobacter sp. MC2016-14]